MSYVESGKKGCSIDLLVELSAAFDVSLDYIVLGQERHNILIAELETQLKADIEMLINHLDDFKALL